LTPEEFTDFYAGSFRRLVGQLYVMTGDRAEAHDAVQEAFVRAWANRGKLDTGVSAGTVKARLARGRATLAPHLRETAGQVGDV
jgi:DNA-directed RNA polymerase specialized sigma24 family protein